MLNGDYHYRYGIAILVSLTWILSKFNREYQEFYLNFDMVNVPDFSKCHIINQKKNFWKKLPVSPTNVSRKPVFFFFQAVLYVGNQCNPKPGDFSESAKKTHFPKAFLYRKLLSWVYFIYFFPITAGKNHHKFWNNWNFDLIFSLEEVKNQSFLFSSYFWSWIFSLSNFLQVAIL